MATLPKLLLLLTVVFGAIQVEAQVPPDIARIKEEVSVLMKQQKYVEALPLLERIAAAEPDDQQTFFYLGFARIAKANTIKDDAVRREMRVKAREAFLKSKLLGNRDALLEGLIQSIPPDGSEGRQFSENDQVNKLMTNAESMFSNGDLDGALKGYQKAFALDPKLYEAALFSGDVYVQREDFANAEIWYQKAIAIDPNRETAYRYSATPFMKQGKYNQALDRYIDAFVAEPYNKFTGAGLSQWSQATGTRVGRFQIEIPVEVSTDSQGNSKIILNSQLISAGKEDGSFAWFAYGATRSIWREKKFAAAYPAEKEYRHSLAEEADALRSILAIVADEKKVKELSPSLAKLKKLNDEGLLEAFVLLSLADRGIAADYSSYRDHNRDKLRRFVHQYMIQSAQGSPSPSNA